MYINLLKVPKTYICKYLLGIVKVFSHTFALENSKNHCGSTWELRRIILITFNIRILF